MSRSDGLWLFVIVIMLQVNGLLLDLLLIKFGWPTITEFCRRNYWAGIAVILLYSAGIVGLTFHLCGRD